MGASQTFASSTSCIGWFSAHFSLFFIPSFLFHILSGLFLPFSSVHPRQKTSNPWPRLKDFWTLRTATLTTATQPYTNNWLGIASTILAICYCQGQGLNVQLFRGTFPADSKRGRICLLHDMRGDSEFEVNWTISMINNFDFKVHLNISFHDKQFWLQGTFKYFFSW